MNNQFFFKILYILYVYRATYEHSNPQMRNVQTLLKKGVEQYGQFHFLPKNVTSFTDY